MPAQPIHRHTRGVSIIAATPLMATDDVDHAGTDRLVDFHPEHGIDGITILGVMGGADKPIASVREAARAGILAGRSGDVAEFAVVAPARSGPPVTAAARRGGRTPLPTKDRNR